MLHDHSKNKHILTNSTSQESVQEVYMTFYMLILSINHMVFTIVAIIFIQACLKFILESSRSFENAVTI